jgi:aminoglycoside phosphotransferase (APT) family kinase protein
MVWPHLEAICERFPPTLVHGDFVEENLRVTAENGHRRLVPLDWEKAGWGVPAVDLVRVDVDLYYELAGEWLRSSRRELAELVLAGKIFRVLVHRWTEKSIGKAKRAEARLAKLMSDAGWETER